MWPQAVGASVAIKADQVDAAAEEISALAGVLGSFAEGAERVLRKMSGLHLSESTIERTTEAAGARVAAHLEAGKSLGHAGMGLAERCAGAALRLCERWTPPACVNKGLAVRAWTGRWPTWRWFTTPAANTIRHGRHPGKCGIYRVFTTFQRLGRQLHREALEVGWTAAEQQIAISDGGNGLEDFFHTYFPKAECILDFWHAKEYLVELAKAIYPGDEAARQSWTDEVCHQLKHEGGPAVRARLETLDVEFGFGGSAGDLPLHGAILPQPRTSDGLPAIRSQRLANRFWPGGVRLQDGGGKSSQRGRNALGRRGANAVCHLRGLYLSEPACWESFWNPPPQLTTPQI